MPEIVYLVSTLRRSGPTHQLKYIISGLEQPDFNGNIITLSPEANDSMKEDFLKKGIKVKSLGLNRIQGFIKGQAALGGMLKGMGATLVHTQGLRPDLLGLGIRDLPVVTTLRNDPFEDYPSKFGKVKGGIMAWQQMRVMHKGANVFACSKSLSKTFRDKYRLDIPWVQNGVDIEFFRPPEAEERKASREKLGVTDEDFVAVSVGSLIPRKDHLTTINGLKACGRKSVLVIAGQGSQFPELQESAYEDLDLRLPGQLRDVREYLHAADVFISSSLGEGLPNTVLEAMACGLPLILSDIPAHRELLEKDENPLVFPVGQAEELASRLKDFFNSDKLELGTKSRKLAEGFSAKSMSATYQEIYRKLLK